MHKHNTGTADVQSVFPVTCTSAPMFMTIYDNAYDGIVSHKGILGLTAVGCFKSSEERIQEHIREPHKTSEKLVSVGLQL